MFPERPAKQFAVLLLAAALTGLAPRIAWSISIEALPDLLPATPEASEFENLWETPPASQLVQALEQLNAGEVDAAITAIRSYLFRDPDSAPAHELLGAALAMSGKIEEALTELNRAIVLNPRQSSAFTKIGDIYLSQGRLEAAREQFEQARQINPADRLNYQRLGYLDERDGKFNGAIENYERGILGTPAGYVGIKLRLGSLYNLVGAFSKTITMLEPVVTINYPDSAAQMVLGSGYLGIGRTEEALARFRRARELSDDTAKISLALGIAYRESGELKASLEALDQVVAAAPEWSTGHYQRGETLFVMQDFTNALAAFRRAEELSSKSVVVGKRVADTLATLGRYEEAAAAYKAQLEQVDPGSAGYLGLLDALAVTYRKQDKSELAESAYLQMIEALPRSGFGYDRLGAFYGYQQRYKDAARVYEKGLEIAPEDAALLRGLSVVYSRQGDHARALATAERLVNLKPDSTQYLLHLAALNEDSGDAANAAKGYEAVLRKDPENIVALNNLALIRSNQGKHASALELAQRARSNASQDGMIQDTYGWVLYRKGDVAEARQVLLQAVALAPKIPTIHYHLGVVSQVLKDDRLARESYTRALELSSNFKEAEEARARLSQLGG